MSDWTPHKPKANVQNMIRGSWDIIYYLPRTSKLWHNSEHSNIPCIADKSNIKCNDTIQIKFQTAHCPRGWIMLPLGKPTSNSTIC